MWEEHRSSQSFWRLQNLRTHWHGIIWCLGDYIINEGRLVASVKIYIYITHTQKYRDKNTGLKGENKNIYGISIPFSIFITHGVGIGNMLCSLEIVESIVERWYLAKIINFNMPIIMGETEIAVILQHMGVRLCNNETKMYDMVCERIGIGRAVLHAAKGLGSDTRYFAFCNLSPAKMFLSLDLLSEYRIQLGAIGPLYVTPSYSSWIFCGGVTSFATFKLSSRRLVSWIKRLFLACWSTFWKSTFKQQLGCRFDIME